MMGISLPRRKHALSVCELIWEFCKLASKYSATKLKFCRLFMKLDFRVNVCVLFHCDSLD